MKGYGWSLKFDPNQPREPAGSPGGGRWTAGGYGGIVEATNFTGNPDADQALREWDDFEAASAMTAASRGEDLAGHYTTGMEKLTAGEQEKFKRQAAALEKEVSASNTGQRILYRGTTSTDPEGKYRRNGKITTRGLSSAATTQDIAKIYADEQYGEGRGVMLHIEDSRGVPGLMRNDAEAILPGGLEFRVTRTWEEGGLFHVTLYRRR